MAGMLGRSSLRRLAAMLALAAVAGVAWGPRAARAAEIRLRPECRPAAPVVTLGDVAEVLASDPAEAARLRAVELFPSPQAGRKRFLRFREVQDLLVARGLDMTRHCLSGSAQVAVLGGSERGEPDPAPPSDWVADRARRRVREAVVGYLEQNVASDRPWTVEVRLDQNQTRLVAGAGDLIHVRGGTAPWTGLQSFELTLDSPTGPVRFSLAAEVSLPTAVVVAARSLPRGTVIRSSDVRLEHTALADAKAALFQALDQVVGLETAGSIPEGKPLDRQSVRAPVLVRRGDVVTVYARAAGIQVRTNARAREDGSLGELVEVESLSDRKTYMACVSGIQEVQVYARAVRANRPDRVGSLWEMEQDSINSTERTRR